MKKLEIWQSYVSLRNVLKKQKNIFDYENIISAYIVLEYVASKGVFAKIHTRAPLRITRTPNT